MGVTEPFNRNVPDLTQVFTLEFSFGNVLFHYYCMATFYFVFPLSIIVIVIGFLFCFFFWANLNCPSLQKEKTTQRKHQKNTDLSTTVYYYYYYYYYVKLLHHPFLTCDNPKPFSISTPQVYYQLVKTISACLCESSTVSTFHSQYFVQFH